MIAGLLLRTLPYLIALAGAAALVAAIHHHGYIEGVDAERAVSLAKAAEQAEATRLAVIARNIENAATQARFDKANLEDAIRHDEANHAVEVERDRLRADVRRAGGLRIPANCPAPGGTAATAEARLDGGFAAPTAGTVALPEQIESDLLNLAAEADAVTEQARAIQRRLIEDHKDATVP
jgi:hypothetical protein